MRESVVVRVEVGDEEIDVFPWERDCHSSLIELARVDREDDLARAAAKARFTSASFSVASIAPIASSMPAAEVMNRSTVNCAAARDATAPRGCRWPDRVGRPS